MWNTDWEVSDGELKSKIGSSALQVVACACLLLGGKTEESPRQLRHIVEAMSAIRWAAHPKQLERVQVRPATAAPTHADALP